MNKMLDLRGGDCYNEYLRSEIGSLILQFNHYREAGVCNYVKEGWMEYSEPFKLEHRKDNLS